MKLMNFSRLDPQRQAMGRKGLQQGSKLEKGVWDRFASNLPALTASATAIRAAIQKRLAAIDVEISRLVEEIARIEGPEMDRRRILPAERMEAYKTYFESLRQEQVILEQLYGPIRQRLQTSRKQEQSLEFYIRWDVDAAAWISTGDALFDGRSGTPVKAGLRPLAEARILTSGALARAPPERCLLASDSSWTSFSQSAEPRRGLTKTSPGAGATADNSIVGSGPLGSGSE